MSQATRQRPVMELPDGRVLRFHRNEQVRPGLVAGAYRDDAGTITAHVMLVNDVRHVAVEVRPGASVYLAAQLVASACFTSEFVEMLVDYRHRHVATLAPSGALRKLERQPYLKVWGLG